MHLIVRRCRAQGIVPHVCSFVAAAQPANHRFKLYIRSEKPCMAAVSDKIVIITGPTAVGKSKLGVALAKQINGEVISADSVQVYNKLDIGSDKITMEDRQGVPHHLIDILEPAEEFSAGDFYSAARASAAEIISRGKVPIVLGGTGFYLRWFMFGKASTPASNPETGEKVQQLLQQVRGPALPCGTAACCWHAKCSTARCSS
jgi:tRNA A37 N6-isopentenylltransferase MiaA